ncbi:hypothetical protein SAMN04487996_104314 [Dyadobacter soli]|uniref:Uncharacterized protein n=1 Tax=Dyadobacter soli TaxID=659014 RepID=A0A1G7BUG2_9BACT|nr:hypothetical protein [Dyadobacter soli]SDE30738.1 hypothetical protein SAMN04487996_104314 [Dyadobacter soli]
MKRKIVSCASALFFLAIFNCKRDKPDPECRDASCCLPFFNAHVEYIQDEPVSLIGPPYISDYAFHFSRKLPSRPPRKEYVSHISGICEKSLYKLEGFPLTHKSISGPDSFPYRVSGKLVDWTQEKLIGTPILHLFIDKIEKIN